ncbi:MAG: hypothetical protein D3924_08430 [Candidatus Electrothrix sp. AR4]|nr:hypothetical protein [Candidatus Electrothrix sp. AR4]
MATEKQKTGEFPSVFDPGYLMVGAYVLGVTVLMLFAWFGGSATALEGEQNRDRVFLSEQMSGQPDVGQQKLSLL